MKIGGEIETLAKRDIQDIVQNTMASEKFPSGNGHHSVYVGVNEAGEVKYVGITGRQPNERFSEHSRSLTPRANLHYIEIPKAQGLSKLQARIIEQNLINYFKLGKNEGVLLNKINSISPRYWNEWGIKFKINF